MTVIEIYYMAELAAKLARRRALNGEGDSIVNSKDVSSPAVISPTKLSSSVSVRGEVLCDVHKVLVTHLLQLGMMQMKPIP